MNNNRMSASEREAYIKNKENEASVLLQSTKEKIPSFLTPDSLKELLLQFSRFHRYSYINIILISSQFPEATHIAGYDTWKTVCFNIWHDADRQVLKQEHKRNGVRLLAPYTQVLGNKDNRRLINCIVSVYDISQTNGLPPMEEDVDFVELSNINRLLSVFRYISPYRITVAGKENTILQKGLSGYCDHSNQMIVLDEKLKRARLLSEMMRQVIIAEIELFGLSNKKLTDLVIECVFFILCHHFGVLLNLEPQSFLFVDRYVDGQVDELATALHIVQNVSHKIIEAAEEAVKEIAEYDTYAVFDEEALLDFEFEQVY